MVMKKNYAKKETGVTLIELIIGLTIIGLVIAGALSLFGSASASQQANQTTTELSALRSAMKSLFYTSGGYGTANVNNVLVTANKVPSTLTVDTSTTPNTITNAFNGTINIVGATTTFTATVTNFKSDVCTSVMTSANGWTTVKAGSSAARTVPITPVQAATDCGAAATQTLVFTGS